MKHMFLALFGIMLMFSCIKETSQTKDTNPGFEWKSDDVLPIVMIHGMLASGDTYAKTARLFMSNKYPDEFLYTFDWNTTLGNTTQATQELDIFVTDILNKTGKSKVVLIGHSAGGNVGYAYCAKANNLSKVAKYVHIGSSPQSKPAGPHGEIPTLNMYSKGDLIVQGEDIPHATNVVFDSLDHYEIATSERSFETIFNFLFPDIDIITQEIGLLDVPKISGRVVSLGENKPEPTVKVTMYYVEAQTAIRKTKGIDIVVDAKGNFNNIAIDPNEYIEFVLESERVGFRTLHYYHEPIRFHNPFVYLRVFPPPGSLAGILLSSLPQSNDQSVIAIFSTQKAILHQRDELIVQNIQLANEDLCRPANSTIALFLYDNGDKNSTGASHPLFGFVPFLKGADIFFDTTIPQAVVLEYNGRKMAVRNYKSETEGVVIAVFE